MSADSQTSTNPGHVRRTIQWAMLHGSPADKVGLVLVDGLGSAQPQVLLTRVKPKNAGETPDLALPRGTREVQDPETKKWHDPRDLKGTDTSSWRKEPLRPALVREAHEEVGVTEETLSEATLHDVGVHGFTSRKGEQFGVHWFAAEIRGDMLEDMAARADDATQLEWAPLQRLDQLVAAGQMNPGYAQVAHHAVEGMRSGLFMEFASPATAKGQPTR